MFTSIQFNRNVPSGKIRNFFSPLELTKKDLLTLVFCLSQNDSLKTHTPPPISCLYYKAYIQVTLIQELNRLQKVVPYQLTLLKKKKKIHLMLYHY